MGFQIGCDGCGRRAVPLWTGGRVTIPDGWTYFVSAGTDDFYFACSKACEPAAQAKCDRRSHGGLYPPLIACRCDWCGKRVAAQFYGFEPAPAIGPVAEARLRPVFTKHDDWYARREPWTPEAIIVCSQKCATLQVRHLREQSGGRFVGSDVCVDERSQLGAVLSGRAGPDQKNPVLGTDMDQPTKGASMIVVPGDTNA